jgi:P27 family predicted phage terminase small subunit
MPGRRPTPTHLKVVRGNPGKRPINAAEPKPLKTLPRPPEHLSDGAREAWGKFATLLHKMGVLTEADVFALEAMCECYADMLAARADVAENGRTYETTNEAGAVMKRPNPSVSQAADADRRFKSYLVDFGLTPAARSKVKTSDPDASKQDKAADYF